jgi:hypothetical protein
MPKIYQLPQKTKQVLAFFFKKYDCKPFSDFRTNTTDFIHGISFSQTPTVASERCESFKFFIAQMRKNQ